MLKLKTVVRSVTDISRHPPTRRETSGNFKETSGNIGNHVGKSREMSGNVGDASGGGPLGSRFTSLSFLVAADRRITVSSAFSVLSVSSFSLRNCSAMSLER